MREEHVDINLLLELKKTVCHLFLYRKAFEQAHSY